MTMPEDVKSVENLMQISSSAKCQIILLFKIDKIL